MPGMTTFASDGSPKTTPAAPEPAATPTPAPAPAPAEPVAEVIEPAPAADVATTAEQWVHTDPWEHDWLEFAGDKLAIRVPTPQAMSGLSSALSKYTPPATQSALHGLFMVRHLSQQSYERVYFRLFDPDDTGYDSNTMGELLGAILNTGVAAFEEATKAAETSADKPGK